MWEFNENTLIT